MKKLFTVGKVESGYFKEEIEADIQPILDEANEKSDTAISISKGANQSLSYEDYSEMITVFNTLDKDKYNVGQNVMIVTLNVPDLWISRIDEMNFPYLYQNDDNFIMELNATGKVQVGHYILSQLETQKVDLTNYVKNTDYATNSKAGIVSFYSNYGVTYDTVNGNSVPKVVKATENDINAKTNSYKAIVPSNLDYAVGSVKASETQSGTAKMWTTTEDGETGLNISTEV